MHANIVLSHRSPLDMDGYDNNNDGGPATGEQCILMHLTSLMQFPFISIYNP